MPRTAVRRLCSFAVLVPRAASKFGLPPLPFWRTKFEYSNRSQTLARK